MFSQTLPCFVIEKSIRALVMEQVEQTQRPVVEMRV
ncbi:MAG: hypothetical protein ACI9JU_001534, partial [Pseudohongiellaceae bacterium]